MHKHAIEQHIRLNLDQRVRVLAAKVRTGSCDEGGDKAVHVSSDAAPQPVAMACRRSIYLGDRTAQLFERIPDQPAEEILLRFSVPSEEAGRVRPAIPQASGWLGPF